MKVKIKVMIVKMNKINNNDNNNYNEINDNLFDEVDDDGKKNDEKTDNFISEKLKKKKLNNLENKVNIFDGNNFERRKLKHIMLKQVSLKKTYSLELKVIKMIRKIIIYK
jgi:hypothetical protein